MNKSLQYRVQLRCGIDWQHRHTTKSLSPDGKFEYNKLRRTPEGFLPLMGDIRAQKKD